MNISTRFEALTETEHRKEKEKNGGVSKADESGKGKKSGKRGGSGLRRGRGIRWGCLTVRVEHKQFLFGRAARAITELADKIVIGSQQ